MKIYEREEMIREEGISQGRSEGLSQGRSEGDMLRLIQLIMKKIAKGKSLETTAEELEEDAASVSGLYELVWHNPDKTAEELLLIKLETEQ